MVWTICSTLLRAHYQETRQLTLLTTPSIAVRISCLYKCTQKSASSSRAKFLKIPHPEVLVSKLESVRVCSNRILMICSLNKSFRHFESSIIFVITLAAADRFFKSALCRSFRTGRMRSSRIAASSGSEGGLTGFPAGFARFLFLFLGFDFPILRDCGRSFQNCAEWVGSISIWENSRAEPFLPGGGEIFYGDLLWMLGYKYPLPLTTKMKFLTLHLSIMAKSCPTPSPSPSLLLHEN